MAEDLGDLGVNITGDWSDLQAALGAAENAAQQGAQEISDAFAGVDTSAATQGIEAVGNAALATSTNLESLAGVSGDAGSAMEDASGQMSLFGEATNSASEQLSLFDQNSIEAADTMVQVGDGASAAADGLSSASAAASGAADSIAQVAPAATEAESGLAGMVEQLTLLGEALVITEGLKEFGEEALTAYGTVQSVTIGLTALTGSAEQANEVIEQIKTLAATEPFAFPEIAPTVQKMVALGVSTEQIGVVMQAAADASAATGNAFGNVANMLDRMSLSGTVNARSMATLGISTQDLGNALGTTAADATAAFKALDQEDRINALSAALQKFAGTAEAEAQGIAGQWILFQNQFEHVMVAVGEDLAPVVADILSFGKTVLSALQDAAEAFHGFSGPVQDVIVVVGLAAAAVVPLVGGLAALGLAVTGLQGIIPALTGLMAALGISEGEAAAATATATTAITAEGAAAALATPEVAALGTAVTETAAAETALGAASGEAAGAAGLGALATGATAAAGAMGGLGIALGLVGGYLAGDWLGGIKDASQQLDAMSGFAKSLGVNLDQTSASSEGLSGAIGKLQAIAVSYGHDVQQGSLSQQQYALALLQVIKAAQSAGEATTGLGSDALAVDAQVGKLERTVTTLQTALSNAHVNLILVKADYDSGAASAADVSAATEGVTKAQKDLDSELGIAVPKLETYKQAMKDMAEVTVPTFADAITTAANKISAATLSEDAALTVSVGVWEKLATSATSSGQQIQTAWDAVISKQKAAGASVDDLQATINSDFSKMGLSITDLIANFQKMASSGDLTTAQVNSDFAMLRLAAGGAGLSMSDLVDQVDTLSAKVGGASVVFQNGALQVLGIGSAATDAATASGGLAGKFTVLSSDTDTLTTAAHGYVTVTDAATGSTISLTGNTDELNREMENAEQNIDDVSTAAQNLTTSDDDLDGSMIQVIQSTAGLINAGDGYLTSAGNIVAANAALTSSYNQVAAAASSAAGAIGGFQDVSGGPGAGIGSGAVPGGGTFNVTPQQLEDVLQQELNRLYEFNAGDNPEGLQGQVNAIENEMRQVAQENGLNQFQGNSNVATAAASSATNLATAIGTDNSTGLTAALTTSAAASATTTTASTSLASAVTDLGTASTAAATAVSTAAATVSNAAQATVATLAALGVTVNGDGTFSSSGALTDAQLQAIGQYQSGLQGGTGAGSVSVSGPTNINGQTSAETAASAAYQASLDPATGLPYRGTASTASIGQVYSSNGASAPSAAYLASIQNSIDPSTGLPYRGTPGAVSGTDLASVAPAWRSPSTNVFDSGALPNNPSTGTSNSAPITVSISGMTPEASATVMNRMVTTMRLAGAKVS